jgi:tRNA (Thr-GGU) A37 N-methylase
MMVEAGIRDFTVGADAIGGTPVVDVKPVIAGGR